MCCLFGATSEIVRRAQVFVPGALKLMRARQESEQFLGSHFDKCVRGKFGRTKSYQGGSPPAP